MLSFELTLVNYRCFAADAAARLSMRPELTGLVGPNNSGKSTLLRAFFELRDLFAQLQDPQILRAWSRGEWRGVGLRGTGDALEIFHNRNDLPVRVELRIPGATPHQVSGIDFLTDREHRGMWKASFRVGPDFAAFNGPEYPAFNGPGGRIALDESLITRLGAELATVLYLPASRIAIGEAVGNSFDLAFGSAFINLWDQWKTGPERTHNEAIQRVTDDIAKLFGFKSLDIAATPDKRDLHVAINRRPFKLRELGSGLAQFIIVLANAATRSPSWILIDEPEISLHPALQLDFLTTLSSYAKAGTVFATHSIGLARCADRVFSLRLDDGRAHLKNFEETRSFQEFLGEMSFAAYRELGFDTVLLVEGVNDIKTVQQFLRSLGIDHRVVVIQLGGSQMIRPERLQEVAEILRLTTNVHALIDSEKSYDGEQLSQSRQDFLRGCAGLRIRALATSRRAIENYLSDSSIKSAFGPRYRALGAYESRASCDPVWPKSESWRAAREMTMEELVRTDVGEFLNAL